MNINLAIVLYFQIHHILLSLYCIKIQASISREGVPGKQVQIDSSQCVYKRNISVQDQGKLRTYLITCEIQINSVSMFSHLT